MKTFKKGTPVRFITPAIVGQIVGGKLSDDGDNIDYSVEYIAANGEKHVRHFGSDELEAIEPGKITEAETELFNKLDDERRKEGERFENDKLTAAKHREAEEATGKA